MVCSKYQERINETALANSADANSSAEFSGDSDLRKHLAECAGCREELESRRALMARIDFGVAAMVAEEPSPALAVLVRQRIAEESGDARSFAARWGWWIGAGTAAAALAAIGFLVITRSPVQTPARPANVASQTVQNISPEVAPQQVTGIQPQHSQNAMRTVPQLHERVVAAQRTEIGPPHFEVIVPPGQREAVLRLAAGLQSGRVDGSVFVTPPPPLAPQVLEIAPLEIKPLDVDAGSSSDSDGSKNADSAVNN